MATWFRLCLTGQLRARVPMGILLYMFHRNVRLRFYISNLLIPVKNSLKHVIKGILQTFFFFFCQNFFPERFSFTLLFLLHSYGLPIFFFFFSKIRITTWWVHFSSDKRNKVGPKSISRNTHHLVFNIFFFTRQPTFNISDLASIPLPRFQNINKLVLFFFIFKCFRKIRWV